MDNIQLNSKEKGVFRITFASRKLNEQYAELVKLVLAGKRPVREVEDFVREHAPGIYRKPSND
jgi:hypothetical protein